ncbi:MAG: DUF6807 family protein, partial [Phycisphaerae bacterium]
MSKPNLWAVCHCRTAGFWATTLCLSCALACAAMAADLPQLTIDTTSITLRLGDRPVGRYRYAEVPFKPYLQELRTPSGINILRDAPFDHLHHHGLMFAVAVDGVNFWEEKPGFGKQEHLAIRDLFAGHSSGLACASFKEELAWRSGGKGLLHETRAIRVLADPAGKASLVSWTAEFRDLGPDGRTAGAGCPAVTFSGERYYGLGMRFVTSMDKTGQFFNADDGKGVEGTNDKQSRWCVYTAEAEGRPVTVAMFDHPTNARHPANWFTMLEPFSYLCATLGLQHEQLALGRAASQPAEPQASVSPFRLSYGVAVWEGNVRRDEIERVYTLW